ncbi:MAG: hypothetical protein KatS3mg076_2770 [Candidatus Binatia bacterium]|nr:MAG: hypothetical protein KatS3mg076_2770 [Candidatus Binatia bacterium]
MERIGIDEFRRLDLRIAEIREARLHPNAERLVVLRVDLGEEERELVAGIRGAYEPAELVGKQIVVVANLAPARIRGVESQGMLLAASDENGVPVLLVPEKRVRAGARVS